MAIHKDDAVNITTVPAVELNSSANVSKTPAKRPIGFFAGIKRYLREVYIELTRTKWPSKNELTTSVVVIIATIIVVAIFLWVCDIAAATLMKFFHIVPQSS
jgi:preprotein translocase SecE subunit